MHTIDTHHIWHPYTSLPARYPHHMVTSAEGVYLTIDNTRVIDGMSSWWSTIFGYNHPQLNAAMHQQIDSFSHVMFGGLTHQPAITLTEHLIALTPNGLDKVFYADSGSVSVEVALKMTLQYQRNKGRNRTKFVTLRGGYHGDTFGAMSVCDPEKGMHQLFQGVLAQQLFLPRPTMHNADEVITAFERILGQHDDIAGCIVEPILQGAGGMNIYHPNILSQIQKLCSAHDILCITDEIATGFGRTGKLFACEYADIVPDIMCVGKALTGGMMSLAACITSAKISDEVGVLMHGPTFMANPLACSAASASLTMIADPNTLSKVQHIEHILSRELLTFTHPNISDIRVFGAVGVMEFHTPLDLEKVQQTLLEHGVWLRPFGKLLYTMPPYITTDEELVSITQAMKSVAQL